MAGGPDEFFFPEADGRQRPVPSAAWAWLRATIDDPRRSAFIFVPLLGFLPLTTGSVATAWYFAGVVYTGLIWFLGRIGTVWPESTAFGCIAALVYFASTLVSPLLFPNALAGLSDVGTSLHFLAFIFLVGALVQAPRVDVLDLYLNGLRAAAIAAFGYGLVELLWVGAARVTAGMSNPIPFADAAILAAGLSMVGFPRLSGRMRIFALGASASGLGASLLSQTRGALLAAPLLAAIALAHVWPLVRVRARIAAAVGGCFLAAALAIAAMTPLPERLFSLGFQLEQGSVLHSADPSTAHRAILWTYGLAALAERPLGFGSQNAVSEVRRLAARDGFDVPPYNHLHNEFLTTAVGRGVIGLAALLLLLAAPVIVAVRSVADPRRGDRIAFGAMLSGSYAVFGMTNVLFGHDEMNTTFCAAYLVLLVACHQAATGTRVFERPFMGIPQEHSPAAGGGNPSH